MRAWGETDWVAWAAIGALLALCLGTMLLSG